MDKIKKGEKFEIGGKQYVFVEHLKDGGNASVWSIKNGNEEYAIKILNEANDVKKERFKKEIEFCEKNKHDNLVPIYEHGEINNRLCYIMPLYKNNLANLIEKGISVEKGFEYILQICCVIEYLHSKNVIHRDIKPENILEKQDKIVIADLGIAHFDNSQITHKNDLLANRGYAAPEQKIKGLSKDITTAVDIFSLGLVINEIFTGSKPEGSNFTLISDIYPWLIDIDKLVERCMRQNPEERPTIVEVSLELSLKVNELQDEINSIKENLEEDLMGFAQSIICDNEKKEKIIKQASYDILIAKKLFENKISRNIEKYNFNYHCNIHYKLDTRLRSAYMKYLLKKRCRRTFLYESNVYKNGYNYEPLNLNDNLKDKNLYEKFLTFLKDNFVSDGELLKLFCSCCNYHCEEIISDLDKIEKEVDDLDDAPIMYIVLCILDMEENIHNIYLENEILVNWEKTILNYDSNDTYMGLLKKNYQEEVVEEIFKKFEREYNPVISRNSDGFVVRFKDTKSYKSFKRYALELSKPYYHFEGDVLDLVRVEKEYEGIIELKLWNSFDVTNVLAKIMGFRKDY